MTISEAISAGIRYLRQPYWNPLAYVELYLVENGCGPWVKCYDPPSMYVLHGQTNGYYTLSITVVPEDRWEPHLGETVTDGVEFSLSDHGRMAGKTTQGGGGERHIVAWEAVLVETTFDIPLAMPAWRTYERRGVKVTYSDGTTAYLTEEEVRRA